MCIISWPSISWRRLSQPTRLSGKLWFSVTFWSMETLPMLTQPVGSLLSPVVRGRPQGGSRFVVSAEMVSVRT